jgi:hypothetical protein
MARSLTDLIEFRPQKGAIANLDQPTAIFTVLHEV